MMTNEAKTLSVRNMSQPPVDNQSTRADIEPNTTKITFTYGIRPIYCFSRIFGVMPFSIIYGPNGAARKPAVNLFDKLWFVAWFFLYSSIIWVVNHKLDYTQTPSGSSSILIFGGFFFLVSIFSCDIIIMTINMCNRFKLIDILDRFTVFDSEASRIDLKLIISNIISQFIPHFMSFLLCR